MAVEVTSDLRRPIGGGVIGLLVVLLVEVSAQRIGVRVVLLGTAEGAEHRWNDFSCFCTHNYYGFANRRVFHDELNASYQFYLFFLCERFMGDIICKTQQYEVRQ